MAVRAARQRKETVVAEVGGHLRDAVAVILVDYRGLDVEAMNALRSRLNADGVRLQVIKNTLARLALQEADLAAVLEGELDAWLHGPTAFAFAVQDPMVAAKHLVDFGDEYDALVIKGGLLGGKLVTPAEIEALAALPSREVLLTQVALGLSAPMRRLVQTLEAPLTRLVLLTEALRRQREEEAA